MRFSKIFVASMLSVLVASGCASYRAATLRDLSLETTPGIAAEGGVSIAAKAFDRIDCKRFLDRDVLAQGYQPVQIYIQNDSDKSYNFALSRISLTTAKADEVAPTVHTSTVGRAVGYGAAALVLWPFAIPAIVDGMKSAEANDALDVDFAGKMAKDTVIAPHSRLNGLLFVPLSEYNSSFTVTLVDRDGDKPVKFDIRAG